MKRIVVIVAALAAMSDCRANPLQVQEAQQELTALQASLQQHKMAYDKAKAAYQAVRRAHKHQKIALKHLQIADRTQVTATSKSYDSAYYEYDVYEANSSHAASSGRLK